MATDFIWGHRSKSYTWSWRTAEATKESRTQKNFGNTACPGFAARKFVQDGIWETGSRGVGQGCLLNLSQFEWWSERGLGRIALLEEGRDP